MSAPRSSAPFADGDEILQEQLIHCFNIQNAVIQNLSQYSQHISLQLLDLRKHVDILTYRVIDVQEQQQQRRLYAVPPPLLPFPTSLPLAPSSASKSNEPFIFTPIRSTNSADAHYHNYNDDDDEEDEDEDEEDEPKITFDRIVDLAPVEGKTGEEDEEILFCERAKLYRYELSTREYKERGTGPMKILQHRQTGHCRLLMRREQIWKICANHQITRDTTLAAHQDKGTGFVWSAIDFAEGVPKEELFCIRFQTRDQAEHFLRQFNEAKEINQKRKTLLNNGNALPPIERISLHQQEDEDVTIIGEARPTAEQIHRARRLQLPLTFYLYENKAPCPGCRGCEREVPPPLPRPNGSNRTIVRARRTLPTNRVPPVPTTLSADPTPPAPSLVELSQESKKSRHVPSQAEHSSPFSLDDFAAHLAKSIVHRAKEELCKILLAPVRADRSIDEKIERISWSSSDSHPGFSFSQFDMTVDASKPFNFNFQGHSPADDG